MSIRKARRSSGFIKLANAIRAEALESRFLLSGTGYVFQEIASISPSESLNSGLTADSHGNLFGVDEFDGANSQGEVYEIPAGSVTVKTVASFKGSVNGLQPFGGVAIDAAGDIFGTSDTANGDFQVFKIPAGTSTIQQVAEFPGSEGPFIAKPGEAAAATATPVLLNNPGGGVICDPAGNVFGIGSGGTSQNDQVFEIAAGSSIINTLASFPAGVSAGDQGGLVMDSNGNLYGTTSQDGNNLQGTIFEVPLNKNQIKTLYTFTGTSDGGDPRSGNGSVLNTLTVDSIGDLFGTTTDGGQFGDGSVFELPFGATQVTTLGSFNNGSNSANAGGLAVAADGTIYGITQSGGTQNEGEVYKIVKNSGVITPLITDIADGLGPQGGPILASNGAIYFSTFSVVGIASPSTFATISNGVELNIAGTAGADTITVTDNGGQITTTLNGVSNGPFINSQSGGGIIGIVSVTGAAGNDSINLSGVTSDISPLRFIVNGAAGNDTVIGTSFNDSLSGGMGSDSVVGGPGSDTINGGPGSDTLLGSEGNDSIFGGAGNDSISGQAASDTLSAGPGSDTLDGGRNVDSLIAGNGLDSIFGGAGNDTIVGILSGDTINGGPGTNETIAA